MDKIITELSKIGKNYFGNSFHFKQASNSFVAKSNFMSFAINNKKNDAQKVNVINWFDDLWFYTKIKYAPKIDKKEIIPNIIFSSSVFQGEISDVKKIQLFRAEWDNFDKPNYKHPQPHWHIYTQREENIEKNFEEQIREEKNPFNKYLESNGNKIVNTDRFHFAMSGQWSEKKSDVHSILIESDLTNWFKGLLNHLKKELEYLKMK